MSSAKQTAVVICPGRGTYNKPELGVLGRQFSDKALLARFDDMRRAQGQDTLSELDGAARYSMAKHTRGDNASALIYAATLGDFRAINPDRIEVVAVTGNSMGWYSAAGLRRCAISRRRVRGGQHHGHSDAGKHDRWPIESILSWIPTGVLIRPARQSLLALVDDI